ncbi:MAG: hypothetical protein ACHQET_07110 [Chitinophagales bacterium]
MRPISSICKLIPFCFFMVFLLSSCRDTRVITITGGDAMTQKLTMIDENGKPADTIYVNAGQKIKWRIKDSTSTVKGFTGFPLKGSKIGTEVLEERPHHKILSKTWVGNVKKANLKGGDAEDYKIMWKDKNEKVYTYDPRIQVNS